MAKVFVAGATGVAGRAAVAALVREGHEVDAVARSDDKAALLQNLGARPVRVDLFDPSALTGEVAARDAVVNLATKIPPPERALLPGAWKENDRLRREASRNLVDACLTGGVARYVQESLGFVYPDSGDSWIDEEVPLDVPDYAASVLDAEREAARFRHAGAGVVLRFGQFYAGGTPHTRTMVATARRGLSPFIGDPDGFVSFIHADDVGRAVVASMRASSGTYNVVDDEPMRRRELDAVLAEALGVSKLRSIPAAAARIGGSKARLLMRSQRVSNRLLKRSTGWAPVVASAREGLARVMQETGGRDG